MTVPASVDQAHVGANCVVERDGVDAVTVWTGRAVASASAAWRQCRVWAEVGISSQLWVLFDRTISYDARQR